MTTQSPPRTHTCTVCGTTVSYLEVFPGPRCIDCYAVSPEGRRMPTAEELTAMWGGPARRTR